MALHEALGACDQTSGTRCCRVDIVLAQWSRTGHLITVR